MPCVHVFRSANHQLGLYLRRMFVPRSKNVVSNAGIHDVGGLKSTAKVSLYDHDYGPSYYARCHKVVAQCTVLLYVRHGLELGCSHGRCFRPTEIGVNIVFSFLKHVVTDVSFEECQGEV